jgi:Ca-activated chloride channel family protein
MLEVMAADFHFLRPQVLWALLPTVALYVFLSRRSDPRRRWGRMIAPHLLDHLTVRPGGGWRIRPIHQVTAVATLASVAAAGPTWEREVSPFAEDTAPLVIALDLSQSMDAIDVQPTRLERAKQKVRDLLALRPGARTALIAYAGSAHTVLPMSTDVTMFETFLDGLSTSIMPAPGKDPVAALSLADSILARDSVPGSILYITDGIGADRVDAFVEHEARSPDAVLVLAIGTSEGGPIRTGANEFATNEAGGRIVATLDRDGLDALTASTSAFVAGSTVDARDVERLQRRIQSNLRQVQQDDPTARWKDAGYYLMIPIVLLALLWFRKGWTVRWSAVALVLALAGCSGAGSESEVRFLNLWLTPDQQGRRLYEAGRYEAAAARFADPAWRAVAHYRAGAYSEAIDAWALADTPDGAFGTGNALARLGDYPAAVDAYDRALAARPGWREAEENRDYVRSLIPPPPEEDPDLPEAAPPPTFEADSVDFGNEEQRGERGEVPQELLSDEQLAEIWLRRLQTSPSEFLRRRFLIEQARRTGDEGAR